jgi:pSer/pThr/pTyr-binding forkhead associated (FHA) protein
VLKSRDLSWNDMAKLRWRGAAGDAERELDAPVIRIGRGAENEMVVDDSAISRVHARLEEESGVWRIVDLGSTNGTGVDLVALRPWQPHPLSHGAVIDLAGAVDVTFLLDEHERTGGAPATTRRIAERAVRLTPAESEVLELLYVHYDSGRLAPRVASIREIAEARFTSTAAVKMALQSLYDKFELSDERNKEALALRAQQWKVTRTRF